MKKKTYDGREVTFITENTQTDWDWLEEAEKSGKARLLGPRDSKSKKTNWISNTLRSRLLTLGI